MNECAKLNFEQKKSRYTCADLHLLMLFYCKPKSYLCGKIAEH
jgi:hypothetical protein